jgi:hypothetical protein
LEKNIDGLVKSHLKRHPGESRGPEQPEILDSGFRRNDEERGFRTFYEIINIAEKIGRTSAA